MSFVNRVIDSLASEDVIDLYFILSDLVDINLTEAEITENACNDAMASARAQGYYTKDRHLYNSQGEDLGPVGKAVL